MFHLFLRLKHKLRLVLSLLALLLLLNNAPANAAVAWVGNPWPAGGYTTTINSNGSFDAYFSVYDPAATPGGGQGAGITCELYYSEVAAFGGSWLNAHNAGMVFVGDEGNNDRYRGTLNNLEPGLYEITARCSGNGSDWVYSSHEGGNLRLAVSNDEGGSCQGASLTDNNIYWGGLGHNSFESAYRSRFGAVEVDSSPLTLRFRTCAGDAGFVRLRLYDDRTNTESWADMARDGNATDASLGRVTYWKYDLPIPNQTTIIYYMFQIQDGSDYDYYRDDDPKLYGGGWGSGEVNQQSAKDNSYQITVYNPSFSTPEWLRNAVIYQVFPERFRNGDATNDPIDAGDWIYGQQVRKLSWNQDVCDPRGADCPEEYSNQFYGGDLQGVIDELDYLQAQGITVLYLNPIFTAPSNHLYDTQDYLKIDPYFGSLSTFQTLAAEAEARGIHLILDGVFNHVSSDSQYFDRYSRWDSGGNLTSPNSPGAPDGSGACESTGSLWRNWFFFNAAGDNLCYDGNGSQTLDYESWYGYRSLPKMNSGLAAVRDYLFSSGSGSVARYWLQPAQGADGWRFDVGADVDSGTATGASNGFWAGFRSAARIEQPNAALLGEEWGDASAWLTGDQWDSVMNYRFRSAVLSWMFDGCSGNGCTNGIKFQENDSNEASSSGPITLINTTQLDDRLRSIQEDYPPQAWQAMMNLMGSHDTNRILFLLKKISNDNAAEALAKYKFLGIFQFTYPGAPTIYYGDEAALAPDGVWDGSAWQDDPYNRAPFPWSDQGRTPDPAMQEHFRRLAKVRAAYPVLRIGEVKTLYIHDADRLYAYARTSETADLALVALNRSSTSRTIALNGIDPAFNGTKLYDVLHCSGSPAICPSYTVNAGAIANLSLDPLSGAALVKGPLPPDQIVLNIEDANLERGATTQVTADVTDLGGQAAPGVEVTFSTLDSLGALSSSTAVSDANGKAVVSFTADLEARGVQTLHAEVNGLSAYATLYIGFLSDAEGPFTRKLTIGPEVLDTSAENGIWIGKNGLAEPVIAVARFSANPIGVINPFIAAASTPYYDIHLASGADTRLEQIEVRVSCAPTCSASDLLWWYNEAGNTWQQFQNSGANVEGGYLWGLIGPTDESPSYANLDGTVVMGGTQAPTPVELDFFRAEMQNKEAVLTWRTVSEINLAGFRLWSSSVPDGEYSLVHLGLIPAFGMPSEGREYSYIDQTVSNDEKMYYRLEFMRLDGHGDFFGPWELSSTSLRSYFIPLVIH